MAFESISSVALPCGILFLFLYALYSKIRAPIDVPSNIPILGVHGGIFSILVARIVSMIQMSAVIDEGYRLFSKVDRSYVLAGLSRSTVIVPPSMVKWIITQPNSILGAAESQRELLQSDYSWLDPSLAAHPVHWNTIKVSLPKAMETLIPEVWDEVEASVNEYWGHDTDEWRDIGVFDTMMKTVARATNRSFVGLPLCRNEIYLDSAAKFAGDVSMSATFIRHLPDLLKPFLAWIFLLPNRWHAYKCCKHLIPLIKERVSQVNRATAGQLEKEALPLDFATWNVEEALKSSDTREHVPKKLAMRLMILNFAAIHTSTFGATQILFDIFSSPDAAAIVAQLRKEITAILSEGDGQWSKATLAKLVKTDSAIRESLRISTFLTHSLDRMVTAPKGVEMPDGTHLAYGTRVATSASAIHHDDSFFENATTYDAFRFCRDDKDAASIVTTSETYLAFGHGRHACPGRFFAAVELKMLLAYILTYYDIKPLASRPPNFVFGGTTLPPMQATIQVRRRKVSASAKN